jgi:hypothetical protein
MPTPPYADGLADGEHADALNAIVIRLREGFGELSAPVVAALSADPRTGE